MPLSRFLLSFQSVAVATHLLCQAAPLRQSALTHAIRQTFLLRGARKAPICPLRSPSQWSSPDLPLRRHGTVSREGRLTILDIILRHVAHLAVMAAPSCLVWAAPHSDGKYDQHGRW